MEEGSRTRRTGIQIQSPVDTIDLLLVPIPIYTNRRLKTLRLTASLRINSISIWWRRKTEKFNLIFLNEKYLKNVGGQLSFVVFSLFLIFFTVLMSFDDHWIALSLSAAPLVLHFVIICSLSVLQRDVMWWLPCLISSIVSSMGLAVAFN